MIITQQFYRSIISTFFEIDQNLDDLALHIKVFSTQAVAGLRLILQYILKEGRVKKVELFTSDTATAEICQQVGFFVRGEKIAACHENGEYKNELAVEYSFFNIADAKQLILAKMTDITQRQSVENALSKCYELIIALVEDKICDNIGGAYLENQIYQMVRDELGPNKVFSLNEKRWKPLLAQTPEVLHPGLERLFTRLHDKGAGFFDQSMNSFKSLLISKEVYLKSTLESVQSFM